MALNYRGTTYSSAVQSSYFGNTDTSTYTAGDFLVSVGTWKNLSYTTDPSVTSEPSGWDEVFPGYLNDGVPLNAGTDYGSMRMRAYTRTASGNGTAYTYWDNTMYPSTDRTVGFYGTDPALEVQLWNWTYGTDDVYNDSNVSVVANDYLGLEAGDFLVVFTGSPSDSYYVKGFNIPGCTYTTLVNSAYGSATSFDIQLYYAVFQITGGTASGPVETYSTASTSNANAITTFFQIREDYPSVKVAGSSEIDVVTAGDITVAEQIYISSADLIVDVETATTMAVVTPSSMSIAGSTEVLVEPDALFSVGTPLNLQGTVDIDVDFEADSFETHEFSVIIDLNLGLTASLFVPWAAPVTTATMTMSAIADPAVVQTLIILESILLDTETYASGRVRAPFVYPSPPEPATPGSIPTAAGVLMRALHGVIVDMDTPTIGDGKPS